MGLSHSPRIVTNGLVGCWDAGNTRSYPGSGTTLTDLSGNGNSITLTNGPTFSSNEGGSILFDGVNDYASFTIPAMTYYTCSYWVKPISISTSGAGGEPQLFGAPGDINGVSIYNSGGIKFQSWSGSSSRFSNTIVTLGNWYNFVITNSSTAYTMYVNGVYDNNFASSSGISSGTAYLGTVNTSTRFLNMNLAYIMYHNRALSATEVLQNYNAIRGRFRL